MKAKLKAITDNSWLVLDAKRKGNVGILSQTIQGKFDLLDKSGERETFESKKDCLRYLGTTKDVFSTQLENVNEPGTFFIQGHPIKYKNPFPIDETHPDYNPRIPTFAKTSNSDVYYAAGWYCINFDKAWKHGNCPKLSTLLEYGYEGPFANKIECRRRLRELNREKRSTDQS